MTSPTTFLRVFVDDNGHFGDWASVVVDEGWQIDDGQRQALARQLNTGETAFINQFEPVDISLVHPQGELDFAGVAALGTAWLINQTRATPVTSLRSRGGAIATWQSDGITWVRTSIASLPPWHIKQLASAPAVDELTVEAMRQTEHTLVWAWVDEAKGLMRARTFAADWDIPEAQGNGSGAMLLAHQLNRPIQITHGQGSVIFAQPAADGQADIGGRIIAKTTETPAARQRVRQLVEVIEPMDDRESDHRRQVLQWIESGAPVFRLDRPDIPRQHLVSYVVPFDEARGRLMLVDHAKAKAWLPPGGHVDVNEDPTMAAVRETQEELNLKAAFTTTAADRPLMVTVTTTKGYGEHTDVSLWYVVAADSTAPLQYIDTDGAAAHRWLTPAEILATDLAQLDPQMHRFVHKLQNLRATQK